MVEPDAVGADIALGLFHEYEAQPNVVAGSSHFGDFGVDFDFVAAACGAYFDLGLRVFFQQWVDTLAELSVDFFRVVNAASLAEAELAIKD